MYNWRARVGSVVEGEGVEEQDSETERERREAPWLANFQRMPLSDSDGGAC
jgi:hypothetical protein